MKKFLLTSFLISLSLFTFAQELPDSTVAEETYKGRNFFQGLLIDVGFNQLKDNPDIMTLNTWRSKGVNVIYYHRINILGERFSINPGLGIGLDNYSFEKNIRFNTFPGDSIAAFEDNNRNFKKSKLSTNYIDVPLELRFNTSRHSSRAFRIAFGGKVGVLFKTSSKIKYMAGNTAVKEKISYSYFMNPFRYGLIGRIGFGVVNLFGYYSLNELFKEGKGPAVTPFMFGITLSTF